MADMGTDNYEQEFTLGLMEKDRKLLRDLNDGLAKIQNGTLWHLRGDRQADQPGTTGSAALGAIFD